jgi:hypothetical protein
VLAQGSGSRRAAVDYSARSTSEYIALETELDALRIPRNDRADAAMSATASWPNSASSATSTSGRLHLLQGIDSNAQRVAKSASARPKR